MLPDASGHLDRDLDVARGTRGDRHDQELRSVGFLLGGDDHDHGPVLDAFVAAGRRFAMPEIGIGKDVSRSRDRP
jgi:hypothetical protein